MSDNSFLIECSPVVRQLAETLIKEVRQYFITGHLEKSLTGKFVEHPDNFWTVRPYQSRCLLITVYGKVHLHKKYPSIKLESDLPSYSKFKISDSFQVQNAVKTIVYAKQLKSMKKY